MIEAEPEHQKEWMDDTIGYISERYPEIEAEQLAQIRLLGERFCRPVARKPEVAASAQ